MSNKERIQNMNTRDLAEFLVRRGNICFKMCEDMTGGQIQMSVFGQRRLLGAYVCAMLY